MLQNGDLKAKGALGFRFFVINADILAMQGALADGLAAKKLESEEFFSPTK